MPRYRDSRVAESNRSAPVARSALSRIDRVPAIDAGIFIFIVLIYPRKVITHRPQLIPAVAQNLGLDREQVRFNRDGPAHSPKQ
jgi:hypothetical protein